MAVARDEAFCFYYKENMKLLEQAGCELVPFSPLEDETLPEGCCGLILGGGYPELYGARLRRKMMACVGKSGRRSQTACHVLLNVVGFSICRMD